MKKRKEITIDGRKCIVVPFVTTEDLIRVFGPNLSGLAQASSSSSLGPGKSSCREKVQRKRHSALDGVAEDN